LDPLSNGRVEDRRWSCQQAFDGSLKFNDGAECASFQATLGKFGEIPFDGIQPRCRCRREVEGPPRMSGQRLLQSISPTIGEHALKRRTTKLNIAPGAMSTNLSPRSVIVDRRTNGLERSVRAAS
jgi:hypothetical protein